MGAPTLEMDHSNRIFIKVLRFKPTPLAIWAVPKRPLLGKHLFEEVFSAVQKGSPRGGTKSTDSTGRAQPPYFGPPQTHWFKSDVSGVRFSWGAHENYNFHSILTVSFWVATHFFQRYPGYFLGGAACQGQSPKTLIPLLPKDLQFLDDGLLFLSAENPSPIWPFNFS